MRWRINRKPRRSRVEQRRRAQRNTRLFGNYSSRVNKLIVIGNCSTAIVFTSIAVLVLCFFNVPPSSVFSSWRCSSPASSVVSSRSWERQQHQRYNDHHQHHQAHQHYYYHETILLYYYFILESRRQQTSSTTTASTTSVSSRTFCSAFSETQAAAASRKSSSSTEQQPQATSHYQSLKLFFACSPNDLSTPQDPTRRDCKKPLLFDSHSLHFSLSLSLLLSTTVRRYRLVLPICM